MTHNRKKEHCDEDERSEDRQVKFRDDYENERGRTDLS